MKLRLVQKLSITICNYIYMAEYVRSYNLMGFLLGYYSKEG